jgi:hypothetical protein
MSRASRRWSPPIPYDAKGLLIAAIEDNDPVIFFEPKRIYNGPFSGYYDRPVESWSKHAAARARRLLPHRTGQGGLLAKARR